MNTLLDIFRAIIYLIVSLIIIFVLGIIYLGFVMYVMMKELIMFIRDEIHYAYKVYTSRNIK